MHELDSESLTSELIETWKKVLSVDRVAVDDSFFSLGGDSMQVIEMLVGIVPRFCDSLDFERFFSTPTIGTLVQLITASRSA
jgi:acyl carrier protein